MVKKKKYNHHREEEEEFAFLHPDITQLDVEWINQPKLYYRYACQLADARMELDETKAELSVTVVELDDVRAEVDLGIREYPTEYGVSEGTKLTETVIKQILIRNTGCKDAQEEVRKAEGMIIKANHKVRLLDAAVHALDHRKASLERLVSLHGQSYFATPKATDENSRETVSDIEKRSARSKVAKKKKRNSDGYDG